MQVRKHTVLTFMIVTKILGTSQFLPHQTNSTSIRDFEDIVGELLDTNCNSLNVGNEEYAKMSSAIRKCILQQKSYDCTSYNLGSFKSFLDKLNEGLASYIGQMTDILLTMNKQTEGDDCEMLELMMVLSLYLEQIKEANGIFSTCDNNKKSENLIDHRSDNNTETSEALNKSDPHDERVNAIIADEYNVEGDATNIKEGLEINIKNIEEIVNAYVKANCTTDLRNKNPIQNPLGNFMSILNAYQETRKTLGILNNRERCDSYKTFRAGGSFTIKESTLVFEAEELISCALSSVNTKKAEKYSDLAKAYGAINEFMLLSDDNKPYEKAQGTKLGRLNEFTTLGNNVSQLFECKIEMQTFFKLTQTEMESRLDQGEPEMFAIQIIDKYIRTYQKLDLLVDIKTLEIDCFEIDKFKTVMLFKQVLFKVGNLLYKLSGRIEQDIDEEIKLIVLSIPDKFAEIIALLRLQDEQFKQSSTKLAFLKSSQQAKLEDLSSKFMSLLVKFKTHCLKNQGHAHEMDNPKTTKDIVTIEPKPNRLHKFKQDLFAQQKALDGFDRELSDCVTDDLQILTQIEAKKICSEESNNDKMTLDSEKQQIEEAILLKEIRSKAIASASKIKISKDSLTADKLAAYNKRIAAEARILGDLATILEGCVALVNEEVMLRMSLQKLENCYVHRSILYLNEIAQNTIARFDIIVDRFNYLVDSDLAVNNHIEHDTGCSGVRHDTRKRDILTYSKNAKFLVITIIQEAKSIVDRLSLREVNFTSFNPQKVREGIAYLEKFLDRYEYLINIKRTNERSGFKDVFLQAVNLIDYLLTVKTLTETECAKNLFEMENLQVIKTTWENLNKYSLNNLSSVYMKSVLGKVQTLSQRQDKHLSQNASTCFSDYGEINSQKSLIGVLRKAKDCLFDEVAKGSYFMTLEGLEGEESIYLGAETLTTDINKTE